MLHRIRTLNTQIYRNGLNQTKAQIRCIHQIVVYIAIYVYKWNYSVIKTHRLSTSHLRKRFSRYAENSEKFFIFSKNYRSSDGRYDELCDKTGYAPLKKLRILL